MGTGLAEDVLHPALAGLGKFGFKDLTCKVFVGHDFDIILFNEKRRNLAW